MQVRWKSELSNVFPLMNDVKEEGCLSHQRWTHYSTQNSLNYYVIICYYNVKHVVYLCDAIVDVVDSEMYLGNKLYNYIYKTKID